jgi:hypothetical protein
MQKSCGNLPQKSREDVILDQQLSRALINLFAHGSVGEGAVAIADMLMRMRGRKEAGDVAYRDCRGIDNAHHRLEAD